MRRRWLFPLMLTAAALLSATNTGSLAFGQAGQETTPPSARAIAFEAGEAEHMDLILDSSLSPTEAERAILERLGFVFTAHQFPTFTNAYERIYSADLPVYISADALLFTVHRSYDAVLKRVELEVMRPELERLLSGLRAELRDGPSPALSAEVRADLDLYLSVALGLLTGGPVAPVAGADPAAIDEVIALALSHTGMGDRELFGVVRTVDWSQFEPRGHYTDHPMLESYFQAMMWLGRTEMRLIELDPMTGESVLRRRQVDAAFGLWSLLEGAHWARFEQIGRIIRAFVGQPDNMTPEQVPDLLADLGVTDLTAIVTLDDALVEAAIRDGHYGAQRIASQIVIREPGPGTLPLSSSFLLFGQAYVIDSHAFSELVFDRLPSQRLMPDPMDVAHAVLGNDRALSLLAGDLVAYEGYAEALASFRGSVDALAQPFWESSLYTLWLASLRTLSADGAALEGLPSVFRTDVWGRRILNTQLASWAELRHDTILYAKQSYSSGITCEFPDAYVDPYPAFYAAIANYASAGHAVVDGVGIDWLEAYFTRLGEVSGRLQAMAERQLRGGAISADELAFVNDMVRISEAGVCGGTPEVTGWFGDLFAADADPVEYDPTIADVHTQPTDENGAIVGRVLHVGTGNARLMVVSVDTPEGPRAYVGAVSTYYEVITEAFERLTDIDWANGRLDQATPENWVRDLMAGS